MVAFMLPRRAALFGLTGLAAAGLARSARAQGGFEAFLAGLRVDARRAGISDATFSRAFAGVQPNQKVIALDHHQPEFTLTWAQYRDRVLPAKRMGAARENALDRQSLLRQVQTRFGVDPYTVVGIWGIESAFGVNKGNYRLTEAMATLAWEGRRAAFFRAELIAALKILQQGDVTPEQMTSGYAGAMGQPQFMPSSYLRFAVDMDGDGRRDIWNSVPDVLGSIANYLACSGWRTGEPWGQSIIVPPGFDAAASRRDMRKPLSEWMQMGVRRPDGSAFSRPDVVGAVLLPDGAGGEAFMVYPNFNVIRRYNPSDFYALAVGLLGNAAA